MNKTALFLIRHRTLITVLYVILIFIPFFVFSLLSDIPFGLIIILDLLLLFAYYLLVNAPFNCILLPAVEALENFDPMPLYIATEQMLSCKRLPANTRSSLLINQCAAILEMGDFQRAKDLLLSIDIDSCRLPANFRLIYLNNYAVACEMLEDYNGADYAYGRFAAEYNALRPGKVKESLSVIADHAQTYEMFRLGNYEGIICKCEQKADLTPRKTVSRAYELARAYAAVGRIDDAKMQLEFIISSGKQTSTAQLARKMLDSLINKNIEA